MKADIGAPMPGDVLDARLDGDQFVLRLASGNFRTLIARQRTSGSSMRIDPQATSDDPDVHFSMPLDHLLPRSVAHTTVDFYREERGRETRLRSPSGFQDGHGFHDGIEAFSYTTAKANLSLSLLRTVRRRPLKVVVIVRQLNFSGGKTTAMFELASVFQAAGFDVTLTALWLTSTPPVYQPPRDVRIGYIDAQMLQAPGEEPLRLVMPEFSASPRTLGRIRTYLAEIDADVVYLPDYDSSLYEIFLDSLPPHVLSILGDHNGARYGTALAQGIVPSKEERHRYFFDAIQRFDAVHVINPLVRTAYEASTPKPVVCITNSVAGVESASADFLSRRRIVAAGRLTPGKGFEALIRAFARTRSSHPEWSLDIFGQGHISGLLDELIGRLGLPEVVTLKGPTDSLRHEMLASSLHVSASRFESFGLTMAEAMGLGVPVLAQHRNAGSAYLLADGRGYIAESGTVESLAAAMDELMSEIELGDPSGAVRQRVSRARHFIGQTSSESIVRDWTSEIHRLYDRKIASLYS
ncbi:MAG: glycosyltransferase [Chloroflexota bacterium]|nr:glycosyltransferase [Chloroflexota bacterium]